MGEILDYLLKIQEQAEAMRPKDLVDVILSTKCPIEDANITIGLKYKGRTYLIVSWLAVEKIEATSFRECAFPSLPFGIPIVENEELVRDILAYVHNDLGNDFFLTIDAFKWVANLQREDARQLD